MPNTPLKALSIPNTGDLPGTWGSAAINPDMTAIDGMLGGVVTLSLSTAASITLTAPAGGITPGAGPVQSQNAVIKLTGTLSGSPGITFPLPGYYIVENNCTVGSNVVALIPGAGPAGGFINAPPGEACHIYTDGFTIKYVNMGRVGSYLDLAASAVPAWISASNPLPYLLCDGTVYNVSSFTALGAQLGSTFGGNGATTFGVPDLRGRYRIPIDGTGARITSAGSGISGVTLGAAGGDQNMPSHTHVNTLSDPGHTHTFFTGGALLGLAGGGANNAESYPPNGQATGSSTTGITLNNVAAGAGASGNVPPAMVAGITLIKT